MSDPRRFPVLFQGKQGRLLQASCPTSIPWAAIDTPAARVRAMINHNQTLERLAERGGLSPLELMDILDDLRLFTTCDLTLAVARIRALNGAEVAP